MTGLWTKWKIYQTFSSKKVWLAERIPGISLFKTITPNLFAPLMSVYTPKKWKSNVNLFDRFWGSANTQEAPCHGLACSKQYIMLVCFINVYLPVKNQSQTPIHSRDIEDQRIVKSHRLRACQGQAGSKLIDYGCLFH